MPRSGPGQNPGYATITLKPAAGDIHLKVRPQKNVVTSGVWASGESVATKDVPRRHRMFPRGAGWSSRPGALEDGESWDGIAESENACTRFGYICPSGEQTSTSISGAWGRVASMIRYNGDLFIIFASMIAFVPGGTGSVTNLYAEPGDTFTGAEVWNGALLVSLRCSHVGALKHFFVKITVGAPYTVINPSVGTPLGTAATASTPALRLIKKVFWEYLGVADFRLLGQVTDFNFQYMITPSGDPYDVNNWGPSTKVGDQTYAIKQIVTSHDTAWFLKRDGVYAVSDANAAAGGENLTPYWGDQLDASDSYINGHYWGSHLVASHAYGLDLIDVNSWQTKDRPRQIAIGFGRPNNTNLNGFYTAFCTDNGWLVAGMRSVINNRSYILYGTLRQRESPSAGLTDVDWFPEVGPFNSNLDIACLGVFTPTSGRPSLWVGLVDGSGNSSLIAVELFLGSSPLADTGHRYTTTWTVVFTDEHWAARGATKAALKITPSLRGTGSGRYLEVFAVAGAGSAFPGSASGTINTAVESQAIALNSIRGGTIRTKAFGVGTATTPVVIDEWDLKADLHFPLQRRGTWLVELSDATEGDLPNFEQPASTEAAIVALAVSGEAFTAIDDEGTSITITIDNAVPWRREDTPMTDLGSHQKDRVLEVSWKVVA